MATLVVPQAAIELAKRFEGFHRVPKLDPGHAHPYLCPAGYWTIGYGHLCAPEQLTHHRGDGEAYLAADLQIGAPGDIAVLPGTGKEPDRAVAAIVDFTFNLGAGTVADLDIEAARSISEIGIAGI